MSGIFDRLSKASHRPKRRRVAGGPQPRHWSQALVENPLTRFVPFSSLLSDHDVITRGGDFLRVWRLDGVAFECADDYLVTERHEALCSLLRNLSGGQWAVWTHRLHRKIQDALTDPTDDGFAKDLSQAYQAHLNQRAMMSNELYLTLVYRPTTSRISRALQSQQRSLPVKRHLIYQKMKALPEVDRNHFQRLQVVPVRMSIEAPLRACNQGFDP